MHAANGLEENYISFIRPFIQFVGSFIAMSRRRRRHIHQH